MTRKMKDSGIEWIGEIPEGWNTGKCKTILVANDGGVWGDDPVGDGTDKTVIRSTEQTIDGKWCIENPAKRDLSRVEYRKARIEENDLLITKSSGSDLHIGKTTIADTYFRDNECYYSNFIQRIRCADYSPKLLWYLFNSPIIREQCVFLQNTTSGIGNINANIIQNLLIPIPPLSTQHRITSYLDNQCAKIDAVLEQTRQSIEEYKRLKQAVITRAVTKGIRPGRKMKDSGIEWIGEVPEGWITPKMGDICMVITDYVASGSFADLAKNVAYLDDPDYAMLVRTADISDKGYNKKPVYINRHAYNYLHNSNLYGGELVFPNIGASVGDVYIVPVLYERMSLAPNAIMVKTNYIDKYYYYYFQSKPGRLEIQDIAQSTAQAKFNKTDFRQLRVLLPTVLEQQQIVQYLDKKSKEMNDIISRKQLFISELESYKKSLIYECVTGKREV